MNNCSVSTVICAFSQNFGKQKSEWITSTGNFCLSGSSGARAVTSSMVQASLEEKERQLSLWSEAGNSRRCWKQGRSGCNQTQQCRAAGASHTSSGTPSTQAGTPVPQPAAFLWLYPACLSYSITALKIKKSFF